MVADEPGAHVVEGRVELGDVNAGVVKRAVSVVEQPLDFLHAVGIGVMRSFEQGGDLEQVGPHAAVR